MLQDEALLEIAHRCLYVFQSQSSPVLLGLLAAPMLREWQGESKLLVSAWVSFNFFAIGLYACVWVRVCVYAYVIRSA